MKGPPSRMKAKDGKKVKKVTTRAAAAPAGSSASGPNTCVLQPPRKPTKDTTMISGPGVVSPRASPSIICVAVSRSEEHTSELQSQSNLVCRLLLEKKKKRCSTI